MSAFIECRACGKQHTFRDDWKTDAELEDVARELGWTTKPQPVRCPDHVDTVIPHPSECTLGHDIAAFERNIGFLTGAGATHFGGEGKRDHFRPRGDTCPWLLHYVANPVEFREKTFVGASS